MKPKQISDILDSKPFFPDLDRINKNDLINSPFIIYDWRIVKDWNSKDYGSSDFALVAIGELGDTEISKPSYTTILSGIVVLRKLRELDDLKVKNVLVTLVKQPTDQNEIWNLI